MQKAFVVVAPDGKDVVISTPFGQQEFKHGQIVYDERLQINYPTIFYQVPDSNARPDATVEEKLEPQLLTEKEEPVEEKAPKAEKVEKEVKKRAPAKRPARKPAAKKK